MSSSALYELLGGSTPENNIAEDYAGIVDYFNRLSGAIEDGNLQRAWETAGGLRRATDAMLRRLQKVTDMGGGEKLEVFSAGDRDGKKVALAAAAFAQDYRIGRLVHPVDQIKDTAVKQQIAADAERNRAFRAELDA